MRNRTISAKWSWCLAYRLLRPWGAQISGRDDARPQKCRQLDLSAISAQFHLQLWPHRTSPGRWSAKSTFWMACNRHCWHHWRKRGPDSEDWMDDLPVIRRSDGIISTCFKQFLQSSDGSSSNRLETGPWDLASMWRSQSRFLHHGSHLRSYVARFE